MDKKRLILGLDVSTTCTGFCILKGNGELVKIGSVPLKVSNKVKKEEAPFIKKDMFRKRIREEVGDMILTDVAIEEPLFSSNNTNTVATLLRFNGMVSDCVYTDYGVVPHYLSPYDARKYAFPCLLSVRKKKADGTTYQTRKLLKSLENGEFTLFADYQKDVDKKQVMMDLVNQVYNIQWEYGKKGEFRKENYDANDSLIVALGYLHRELYGEIDMKTTDTKVVKEGIEYTVSYWGKEEKRFLAL